MNKLAENLANKVYTENQALTNRSTLSPLLDLFGAIGAMRKRDEKSVLNTFQKAFEADNLLALKTLFYARDIRGGQGERQTFRTILKYLAKNKPEIVIYNLNNIVEMGRWDDLFCLVDTPLEVVIFDFMAKQVMRDIANLATDKPVSLLGKWLPSENTSSKATRSLARKFRSHLHTIDENPERTGSKGYRQLLSALRKRIQIVEREMCAKEWDKIDYSKVPSVAGLRYRKAFYRNDEERYKQFMADVTSGKKEVKASVLYPYDIVSQILDPISWAYTGTKPTGSYNCKTREVNEQDRQSLDMYWKALPNYLEKRPHNGLVVADTSGSMRGLPIAVAVSLAIYFAERNIGKFQNNFISFSANPMFHEVEGKDIYEKVMNLVKTEWNQNTNLQRVFDLILDTATENKISPDEMPETIYIVSDMEFDEATQTNTRTNFQVIREKYENANYEMPELVFWNVNSRNAQSPITINETGVKLVSGCNPNILTSLLEGKDLNAESLMLLVLNQERYNKIVL